MQSNSRRAFLTGRRVERSPWETFLTKLRRYVEGPVQDLHTEMGTLRLVPASMQDVYYARSLCAEFGVTMALDGLQHPSRLDDLPLLWIDPGMAMSKFNRLDPDDSRWFVQPGCLVGELEQAGLPQFKDQPPHLTVAAWLADRQNCDWDFGDTAKSGLVHALVMLADGTRANLGAFGVHNQKPLDNIRLQNMIPKLFELVNSTVLKNEMLESGNLFNGKYRLDALLPNNENSINLAHLLLGHGGELGWVEWLVFDQNHGIPLQREYNQRYGIRSATVQSAYSIDSTIKSLFDGDSLFPQRAQKF